MPKPIVYSTPVCPYCQMVKKLLKKYEIEFEEKNVAEDKKAAKKMIEESGQMSVPVVNIDGQIIIGFDKEKLTELLGI